MTPAWNFVPGKVTFVDRWRFEFAGKDAATVCAVDEIGSEFIAWPDSDPTCWAWWLDPAASPVLNPEHLNWARWHNEPATLYSTPADWLAAGCDGAVILDPTWYTLQAELREIRRLIVDDDNLVAKIKKAFRHPLPEIRVTRQKIQVAKVWPPKSGKSFSGLKAVADV